MEYKKSFSFLFYFLSIFIYLFLFNHDQSTHSLIIFAIIFILLRNIFGKSLQGFESKLLFLTSLFIYQTVYPISISQSMNTIQLLVLSRNALLLSILLFLSLFIFFLIYQDKFHLSYTSPNILTIKPIKLLKEKKRQYTNLYDNSKDTLNRENMKYFVSEIPRHGYIRYTSQYNLPDKFFTLSEKAIEADNNLYIILSKTGSPASEVISLFTNKDFNHLSLSFDKDLNTMVSYNGGNDFQKPGLNTEDLYSLYQKEDSQVLVYSLKATKEQKKKILGKIKKINQEGSAYNVLGLVTNHSVRPNMMFCSQFVYSMLQAADLDFFEATSAKVKPTDFIEKDDHQKLQFEYDIDFSNISHKKIS